MKIEDKLIELAHLFLRFDKIYHRKITRQELTQIIRKHFMISNRHTTYDYIELALTHKLIEANPHKDSIGRARHDELYIPMIVTCQRILYIHDVKHEPANYMYKQKILF